MRPVQAIQPPAPNAPPTAKIDWCIRMIVKICEASQDEGSRLALEYTTANVTKTRTLDPTTATAGDVGNVLATFLEDSKKGGKNRVG